MENNSLEQLEKKLMCVLLCLALLTVIGVLLLIRFGGEPPAVKAMPEEEEESVEYDWGAGLSDASYWLPENCSLYETIPEILFTDRNGKSDSIRQWEGGPAVVVFWASWCGDCQSQMARMAEYEKFAGKYGEVSFLYLNKTDGEQETEQAAAAYFDSLKLDGDIYYDTDLQAYQTLGIHNIPTLLFLNKEGKIAAWSSSQVVKADVFEALLQSALWGSSRATADFIKHEMMGEDGGIVSVFDTKAEARTGREVLSESQGLFLLYAAKTGDKELFEKAYSYVAQHMWQEEGLTSWKVDNGEESKVNALIDDFRIYRALKEAQDIWGSFGEQLQAYESALLSYGMKEKRYVDFYDSESRKYASRLTLCYADLEAMKQLAEISGEFGEAYSQAEELLVQGQISNQFPLYYSWYNYDKKRYERDDLNAAEAMIALLQLAKQDKLRGNTVKWLKAQMEGEGIKARYTVDGEVVKGYNYESTAVYAAVAMIADEIGDLKLRGEALKRMEKMRITDTSLRHNGAFGEADGSGITSFDQLLPVLTYVQVE